ncbi:hypothetical protein DL93DRAFT_1295087 [Clavulina sp. PMI_390]|nr:hypothetical protein DL93DRAFT_1295087 [Clavulina sp. PMI_390]
MTHFPLSLTSQSLCHSKTCKPTSYVRPSMMSQLPLDIILLLATFLDVKDLVSLSVINRNVCERIQASKSLWKSLARDAITCWALAPHSIDVDSLSASEARTLACRPYRLDHFVLHPNLDATSEKSPIGMSPLTLDTARLLITPDGSSIISWCALPGNRWVCALVRLADSQVQLCIWDSLSSCEIEGVAPASSITSAFGADLLDESFELWPQFDASEMVVNILLCFDAGADCIFEVYQIAWLDELPVFSKKASRRRPLDMSPSDDSPNAWLDGPYACLRCYDGVLLCEWKYNLWGVVEKDFSSVSRLFLSCSP